jgi:dihydrofolate reductase
MPDLIYSAIASLDGFLADEQGSFDWAVPDEQVHAFVNDQQRTTGTHLYGRRTYELMIGWETMPPGDPVADDFASIWRAADKIVYSTTLAEVSTPRTRLEPVFDPVAVARLKQQAERNLVIGGPTLAAAAFAAGLVDEIQLFLHPILVGGGLPALPRGIRQRLVAADGHRFEGGVQFLRYRVDAD